MKVLHFLDSVNRGGAETIALDVCRNAAAFGIDLTIVTTKGGTMLDEFAASGAEFIKLERRFPIDFKLVKKLRRIITEREIKITQGYQAVECLHLYLAARKLKNVKVVMSHQGFITGKKNHLTARFLAPRIDANITVSKGLLPVARNGTRHWYGQKFSSDLQLCGRKKARAFRATRSKKNWIWIKTFYFLGMVANFHAARRRRTLWRSAAHSSKFLPNIKIRISCLSEKWWRAAKKDSKNAADFAAQTESAKEFIF